MDIFRCKETFTNVQETQTESKGDLREIEQFFIFLSGEFFPPGKASEGG